MATCFSSFSNAQEITTQTHSIPDDGYVNVPLQFDFSYYGQTFNNSWMFSNGIISFQDPTQSGLDGFNLGVQPISSAMGNQFNYSIFPLWTDLINISGTFRTDGTENYQQYSWIGISPFYDANRLNTFSVEIKPDGSISANYSLLNIDYGQIGLTGNISLGEYDPIASLGGTTSFTNWERITQGAAPPPSEDPCIADPLSSSSCPGYTQALLSLLPAASQPALETISSTPESTVEVSSPIVQQPIAQSPISATVPADLAPTAAPTPTTLSQSSSSGSRVSLSTILNILGNEQSRIAGVERSTVDSSVEQSAREADKATEQAEAIAAAIVTDSIESGLTSARGQMAIDQQQASQSSPGGLNALPSSSILLSLPESGIGIKLPEPAMVSIDTATSTEKLLDIESSQYLPYVSNITREETLAGNIEERSESAVSFSGFSAVNVLNENTLQSSIESSGTEKAEPSKSTIPNNQVAGDITLASLGSGPQGFQAYSTSMPDSAFYAPRDIYRGQRNVDNQRLLRGLTSGGDRLHQEMLNQQYGDSK